MVDTHARNTKQHAHYSHIAYLTPSFTSPTPSVKQTILKILQALIREKIIDFSVQHQNILFHLTSHMTINVENVKLSQLYRCIDFDNIFLMTDTQKTPIASTKELLDLVYNGIQKKIDQTIWKRFLAEIANHEINLTLCMENNAIKSHSIKKSTTLLKTKSMLDWLNTQSTNNDRSLYMEQLVSQGHPIHPCSKTKVGFSKADVLKYSPEFNPIVKIPIAALQRDLAELSLSEHIPENYHQWFHENFPFEYAAWVEALNRQGYEVNKYIPVPIHPWQATYITQHKLTDLIEQKLIVIFDDVSIEASPTLSFRTLKPVNNKFAPYLKLPLAIQATSVFRTLSITSTQKAPIISDVLIDIFKKERNFNGHLKMLPEVCGVSLSHRINENSQHFGVVFRESVDCHIDNQESSLVVAALFEKSPISGLPILIEQMQTAGINHTDQAIRYFKKYATMIINSYLRLYLLYGIALEGHQQNTLIVFRDSLPAYFIARDFDGSDIDEQIFKATVPNHFHIKMPKIFSPSVETTRNTLLHSVYQSHIGEIIMLMSQYYQCSEKNLWQIVARLTQQCFLALKPKVEKQRWEKEYQAILIDQWNGKALLSMRLLEEGCRDRLFFKIENPLSKFSE